MFVAASCMPGSAKTPNTGVDREGNPISLPTRISKVISMGPSNTEILAALGCAEKIVAADTYSKGIDGVRDEIAMFDMEAPDGERIISIAPDVIFVNGMLKAGVEDPFGTVANAGICVIYIPASSNVADIKEDIRFIAAVMGVGGKGEKLISEMDAEINKIKKIGDAIADRKTVMFEVSASPFIYTTGRNTFVNEMIELIGARNIFGVTDEGWFLAADEIILNANPDVILTSTNYIDDPIGEIMSRPGWDSTNAVRDGNVHYIDTDASNRASHNIVKALKEMAKAVYPDAYD